MNVERVYAAGRSWPWHTKRRRRYTINPAIGRVIGSWTPVFLVFVGSASVMILEIVAGRVVARHAGTSLITWTSIIAVVLAGISLGNYLAGLVADRTPHEQLRRRLAMVLQAAAFTTLATMFVIDASFSFATSLAVPWSVQVILGVSMTFLLPSIQLGALAPIAAKWALADQRTVGRTVGSLYAWGSIGAIVGTILTGFVLLAWFSSTAIVTGVALFLSTVALAIDARRTQLVLLTIVVVAVLILSVGPQPPTTGPGALYDDHRSTRLHYDESPYQTIEVALLTDDLRVVLINGLAHGYVDLMRPDRLVYEYVQAFATLTAVFDRENLHQPFRALHLGGGAFTLPRFLHETYPDSTHTVVEIDRSVTEANHRATGLPRPPPFEVLHEDARTAIRRFGVMGLEFDLVFSDAFHGLGVPSHLATREFFAEVARVLTPNGLFVANVIDDFRSSALLSSYAMTLSSVFPHVTVLAAESAMDGGAGRDTFVVVGSRRPDLEAKTVAESVSAGVPLQVIRQSVLDARFEVANGTVLTDEFAPVDRLISDWSRTRQ